MILLIIKLNLLIGKLILLDSWPMHNYVRELVDQCLRLVDQSKTSSFAKGRISRPTFEIGWSIQKLFLRGLVE